MIDREDLESLSSAQLHDRAIGSAKAGGDIDWLWHVLGSMPAAEGAVGDIEDSGIDVAAIVSAINRYLRADRTSPTPSARSTLTTCSSSSDDAAGVAHPRGPLATLVT